MLENRTLYADDCLDVLNDPERIPDGSVDLIYLDPPFNSNSTYNLPFRGKDKSLKPVAAFEDTWLWQPEDNARLAELGRNPSTRHLEMVIEYAQSIEQTFGGGQSQPGGLPVEYGATIACDEARAERDGKHLSTL